MIGATGTLKPMLSVSDPSKLPQHDAILSAAQRALAGASLPYSELGDTQGGTPSKAIPMVKVPEAPRVMSRTSPGTVPMKTSGFNG